MFTIFGWIIIVLATGLSVWVLMDMSKSTRINRLNPWVNLAGLVVLFSFLWVPCLLAWVFFGRAELGIIGFIAVLVLAHLPMWKSMMDYLYARVKAPFVRSKV